MDLHSYIRPLTVAELEAFAVAVGTTIGHLRNVAYKSRKASAALAMQVEIETKGAVSRRELRPDDWWLIWVQDQNQMVERIFPEAGALCGSELGGPHGGCAA